MSREDRQKKPRRNSSIIMITIADREGEDILQKKGENRYRNRYHIIQNAAPVIDVSRLV